MKPQQEIKSNIPKDAIFVAGNVPSLKNSKQIFVNKKTGKRFVTSSDLCKEYEKETKLFYSDNWRKFLDIRPRMNPLKIKFYFVRKDNRVFDYINVVQIILDLMVKNEWIIDDNMKFVIPIFEGYHVDKNNAGVYIYF